MSIYIYKYNSNNPYHAYLFKYVKLFLNNKYTRPLHRKVYNRYQVHLSSLEKHILAIFLLSKLARQRALAFNSIGFRMINNYREIVDTFAGQGFIGYRWYNEFNHLDLPTSLWFQHPYRNNPRNLFLNLQELYLAYLIMTLNQGRVIDIFRTIRNDARKMDVLLNTNEEDLIWDIYMPAPTNRRPLIIGVDNDFNWSFVEYTTQFFPGDNSPRINITTPLFNRIIRFDRVNNIMLVAAAIEAMLRIIRMIDTLHDEIIDQHVEYLLFMITNIINNDVRHNLSRQELMQYRIILMYMFDYYSSRGLIDTSVYDYWRLLIRFLFDNR